MRRLAAYLTLTFTLIFGAALNMFSPLRNLVSNHEYQTGREFVYRISDKDPDKDLDPKAIDEIVTIMDRRMQNYGVSEYNIAKEGKNIVRVSTTLQSTEEYNRLQVYLNYNANFTMKIGDDDNTEAILSADQIFADKKARVEYRGPYPFIVFPLSDPTLFETTIVDVAQKIQEEKGSQETAEGEDKPALVKEATIVLWSDYDPDKDSYMSPVGDTQGKIFLSFDYRSMWWNEDKTEIGVASPLEGMSENHKYTTAQIKKASETARYMMNIFNAGTLDYKVDFLYANKAMAPTVEPLINLGTRDNIALSATFFASLVTMVVVLVILFAIYRLPVLNALSSSLLTFLGTMIIFNAIQVEFSTSAIIGVLIVTFVSILSTILYAAKFRNEVYKGRTFKKAHTEAITRSSFLTIDILVLLLVTGIFTYFFGGAALTGFATTLIFGSIVMVASVLIHNSLLLPLLAHNRVTSKSYTYYGINESKVPDTLKDEKQTYFGRFVNHKPENRAKLSMILTGSLSLITAVLLIVFSAVNINPYNLVKYDENITRVYFQVSENSDINPLSPTASPVTLLNYIELDGEALTFEKKEGAPVYETQVYKTMELDIEDEIEVTYNFYVYNLIGVYTGEEEVNYKVTADAPMQSATLSEALDIIVKNIDDKAVISFNAVEKEAITPHFGRIAWVSLVILAVTSFYLTIRFGLTRGITNFVESFVAASLVFLFLMVTRLAIPPLATMGAFVAILAVSFLNVVIFTNIKDVQEETASKGLTHREHFELGLRYSLSVIYITVLMFSLGFLVFTLIGPLAVSSVYLASAVAMVAALLVVVKYSTAFLSGSLNVLDRLPKLERQQKTVTGKQRTSIRSNEPEEAIFIGIND